MSGNAHARNELHDRLVDAIGREAANTLMEALPPIPWSDLATKADVSEVVTRLDGVESRLDGVETRLDRMDLRFDRIDARFEAVAKDAASMEERLTTRMESMEHRITAALRGYIITAVTAQTRTMMLGYFGAVLSTAALVVASAKVL